MKDLYSYILESNRRVGGTSYTEQELYDCVIHDINDKLEEAELINEVEIVELWCHGSRMRGDFRPDSDIDVVMFYKGSIKEDALFDILNDGVMRCTIEGHAIDINPVQVRNDSDIKRYKKRSEDYDKEKLSR